MNDRTFWSPIGVSEDGNGTFESPRFLPRRVGSGGGRRFRQSRHLVLTEFAKNLGAFIAVDDIESATITGEMIRDG